MAAFIVKYEIHIGDTVCFYIDGQEQVGIVQDVSQIPDISVEGFYEGEYKRWTLGIDSLEILNSEKESGTEYKIEIEPNEPLEFIHDESDFTKLKYRYKGDKNFK